MPVALPPASPSCRFEAKLTGDGELRAMQLGVHRNRPVDSLGARLADAPRVRLASSQQAKPVVVVSLNLAGCRTVFDYA